MLMLPALTSSYGIQEMDIFPNWGVIPLGYRIIFFIIFIMML